MQPRRDNRYRGRQRRRAAPQRKPGHLCTNYTEDVFYLFGQDLAKVRSVWPPEVLEGDRKAQRNRDVRQMGITMGIVMLPGTAFVVWMVFHHAMPWWMVPVVQSAVLAYFAIAYLFQKLGNKDEDIDLLIYREADRRGIKYDKGSTPLYNIMNRINYDYNTTLWNRNFKWK